MSNIRKSFRRRPRYVYIPMYEGRFQSIIERDNDFLISNAANVNLPYQTKFIFLPSTEP